MILDELATYLQGIPALNLTIGTNLFKAKLPESPDACVALIEYPGIPGEYVLNGAQDLWTEYPLVQVLVRDAARGNARTQAEQVYRQLRKITNATLSNVYYIVVEAMTPPYLLDVDLQKARPIWAFNIRANKVPS